ncbi:MAG: 1,4-dihydroxy-6-naphthoate synthase [Planctomycetota bacterium]
MPDRPPLRFGFSPCPNDTFAFWALAHDELLAGGAPSPSLPPFVCEPVLADIEALNQRALGPAAERLPVTKLSLPALAQVIDQYAVLDAGAALGFGCGPLVVSASSRGLKLADLADARVAIPGQHTTANLLFASLLPKPREVVEMRFDEILSAVEQGRCDAGLVIHESRFTYREHGLVELADLGVLWEQETGGPLPLGVIAARRDLDPDVFEAIERGIAASVRIARAEPEKPRLWIRQHAQEMADDVCDQHIALYVNDFTESLGDVGRRAIDELLARGRRAGLLPAGGSAYREQP